MGALICEQYFGTIMNKIDAHKSNQSFFIIPARSKTPLAFVSVLGNEGARVHSGAHEHTCGSGGRYAEANLRRSQLAVTFIVDFD